MAGASIPERPKKRAQAARLARVYFPLKNG